MKLVHFPDNIINNCNLNKLADDKGCIYVRCERRMYGLLRASIIAQQLLENASISTDTARASTNRISGPINGI